MFGISIGNRAGSIGVPVEPVPDAPRAPIYVHIEEAANGFVVRTSNGMIPTICDDMEGVLELLCETFGVELED